MNEHLTADHRPAGKIKGRIGRPPTGIGPVVAVRLWQWQHAEIDAWIKSIRPGMRPTKAEMVRRCVSAALGALGSRKNEVRSVLEIQGWEFSAAGSWARRKPKPPVVEPQ